VNYKKLCSVLFLFICIVNFSGCGNFKEKRILSKSKKIIHKKSKNVEELVTVNRNLKRIINMKITAVQLLVETDRLLGRKYMEIGSYNLAKKALKEAEDLKPNNAYIKKDLGECYYFLGTSSIELDDKSRYFILSKKYYQKAIEINSDLIEAIYGLGLLMFFGYNDVYGAIDQMEKILEYEPKNVDAHFALGRFYYEIGNLGKSLNEYIALTQILSRNSPKIKKVEDNIIRINRELEKNE